MKAGKFIAVEIGEDGIRLADFVRSASGQIELLDYGFAPFETTPQVEMAKEAVVATTLNRLLDKKGISARRVEIALEGQSIFSRLVKLPSVAANKLEQAIHHEAAQSIPFPINEVAWDYQLIGQDGEVLLVAVKAELSGGMAHAVQATGLSVEVVDVAPVALSNAVRYNYPDLAGTTLVVDFGMYSSTLVFIDGPRTFFRSLPVAGSRMDRMLQEIERSITFYRNQQEGNAPERVLLSGNLRGLDEPERQFADRLKLPITILDPLKKVKLGPKADGAEEHSLGILVGLAARMATPDAVEVNLMPEFLRKARSFRRRQPLMVACIAVAALMTGAGAVGLSHLTGLGEWELAGVSAHVAALEEVEQRLIPVERQVVELENCNRVYCAAIAHRTIWLESLIELRVRLPEGMFLLAVEPLREDAVLMGMRITVMSYLDKEPESRDTVILLRDSLRSSDLFSVKTKVSSRPTKDLFARRFVMDLFFEEPMAR